MDRLETRVPPPVWAALFLVLVFAISRADLGWGRADASRVGGLLVAGAGTSIAVLSVMQVMRAGTTIDPHDPTKTSALVTGGVYRLTRNPMYVGLASLIAGAGLWWGAPIAAAVGTAGFVGVVTRLQIIPEERQLLEHFPETFPAFRARTRRWL